MFYCDAPAKLWTVRCIAIHAPINPFLPRRLPHPLWTPPSRRHFSLSKTRSKVDALCLRKLGVLLGDWLPSLISSFKSKEGDNHLHDAGYLLGLPQSGA